MLGKFGYFCGFGFQGFCYYKSEQTQFSLASPYKLFQSLGSEEELIFYLVAFSVVYTISIIVKVVVHKAVFGDDLGMLAMKIEFLIM